MPVATKTAKEVRLHPGQQAAWEATERFVILIAGTGGGKTWMGPLWLSREIEKAPNGQFMVIAPTHKLLMRATVPMLKQMFQGTNLEGVYKETKGQYLLPDGGVIYCLSADKPELVEGGQINAAWLDEAGQMTRWIWVVIQARLGLKQGRCLITTTPYAMNWLYSEVYKKWLKRDPNYFVVQFSSTQNPYYPQEEFERMKGELTEAEFAMRYQGEFTQLQGLVYRDFHKCVVPHPVYKPQAGDMAIGGIDFGYSAPTAIITAVRDDKGRVHIQREFYKSGTLIRDMAEHLDPNASYWADPAARREIEELQFYHPDIKSAINDVRPGIMKVNEFIRDGRLIVPEDVAPNMISEAAMYAFAEGKDAPVQKGEHHALDATRYMIMGLEEAGHLDIYFL